MLDVQLAMVAVPDATIAPDLLPAHGAGRGDSNPFDCSPAIHWLTRASQFRDAGSSM